MTSSSSSTVTLCFTVLLFVSSFVVLSSEGESLCANSEECLHRVERLGAQTRIFSGKFMMTKEVSLLDDAITSEGSFAFQAPDHAVWFLANGETLLSIKGKSLKIIAPGEVGDEEARDEINALGPSAELLLNLFVGRIAPLREKI